MTTNEQVQDRCPRCGFGECECITCPVCGAWGTYDEPYTCMCVASDAMGWEQVTDWCEACGPTTAEVRQWDADNDPDCASVCEACHAYAVAHRP